MITETVETVYRIYTEDKKRPYISSLFAACAIPSYTFISGSGVFEYDIEDALIIEVILPTSESADAKIKWIAEVIKRNNQQKEVLVTKQHTCVQRY